LGDYAPGEEEPQWDDEYDEILARLQDVGHNVVGAAELEARQILGNEDYDRIKAHHVKIEDINLESLQMGIEVSRADIENAKAFASFNYAMSAYRNSLARVFHAVRWAIVAGTLSGIGWEISRLGH
jgi:hypothetical protein